MTTRLHGILVDGLSKPLVNTTVTLLSRGNTLTILNGSEAVFRTDSTGAYNITVNSGHYNVIVGPQGIEPYKAGEIVIYADSPEGSLNGYLVNWVPEELTPDIIKQVQDLVSASENHALQAGRAAAAANADATDARNSKTAAASSASDSLVSKNDAAASATEAKAAQAGASGSANTANAAVTTIQGLKTDVETLKNDTAQIKTETQGIKDSALTDITTAKTDAVNVVNTTKDNAVNSVNTAKDNAIAAMTPLKDAAAASAAAAAASATQAATHETNAAASATAAKTSETNSGASATRAETAATNAEATLSQSLLKENNLSDLSDNAAARKQMGVDRFINANDSETQVLSGNKSKYLYVRDDKYWGAYDATIAANIPLSVASGGTGALDYKSARLNLNTPCASQIIPDGTNILGFFIENKEGGNFSSGSSVTNLPYPHDWWTFDFRIHGRDASGKPEYGSVTAISSGNRIFIIMLVAGNWPSGWFEIYRQHGWGAVYDGRITSKGGSSLSSGLTVNYVPDGTNIIGAAEFTVELEDTSTSRTIISSGKPDRSLWTYMAYNSNSSLYNTNGRWQIGVGLMYFTSNSSVNLNHYNNMSNPNGGLLNINCFTRTDTSKNVYQLNVGDDWIHYSQLNADGVKQFTVNGNIQCNVLSQGSDRDLKDSLEIIPNATQKLRGMNGYTYILKESGLPYAGVIAQEVKEVLPEAVGSYFKYDIIGVKDKDPTVSTKVLDDGEQDTKEFIYGDKRYYNVDYSAMVGLLVQVCRESDDRITKLENELTELKALVAKLTNTTNESETNINPTILP